MLERVRRKTKCNYCTQCAEYKISYKKEKRNKNIYLCEGCLTELYFDIAKEIVPKSPRNILNRF